MLKPILIVTFSLVFFSSCSVLKTAALRPTGKIIYDATFEQQVENDWELFEQTLGSNIKLIEAFLSQDPANKDLMASLLKAYAAKGFGIHETYYFEDVLKEVENSIHKKRALATYTKALEVGLKYLMASGLSEDILTSNLSTPDKLIQSLDAELSGGIRDVEAVLFTAQSLGSLVNLQRENMKTIAYLPVAKALFDWACSKKPDVNFGTCDIFYATYDSGRPRMLGGDPQKGKEKFLKAIDRWPENYLVRQSYVQFYAIPMLEEDAYQRQKLFFNKVSSEFEKSRYWTGDRITIPKKNLTNVYNMIAIKRMELVKKYEEEIF